MRHGQGTASADTPRASIVATAAQRWAPGRGRSAAYALQLRPPTSVCGSCVRGQMPGTSLSAGSRHTTQPGSGRLIIMTALLSTMVGGIAGCALAMAGFRKRSDDLTDAQVAKLPADMEHDKQLIAAYRKSVRADTVTETEAPPNRQGSVPAHE
jgi:hypothetical protein